MKPLCRFTLVAGTALLITAGSIHAASNKIKVVTATPAPGTTPAGTWKQFDDVTGKATSLIEITSQAGGLEARVIKTLYMTPEQIARDGKPPRCTQCRGKRHNQPIEGMTIMWGVHKDGKVWDGGHILDPNNGKTYKVKLSLKDEGHKLDVRGYIGISLFGRTQTWVRQ